MSRPIISASNLGKRYRLGSGAGHDTLRDHIAHGFRRLSQSKIENRKSKNENELFWALKDVSFDVQQGDVIGVIGRNGAGKSTLLKILSQITEPTEGEVRIRGRVASLLEVGTGFHPELSGRENVFLNGAILGMSKAEIKKKFDEIVAFAEVEKFLDTPVKRYSSGMYVRLAFAVAAHLEPEILVVDEVLAVGDAQFQKKCLGKMHDVAGHGRTILFVSHNMGAVRSLCSRAVLLSHGALVSSGGVEEVLDAYLGEDADSNMERVWHDAHSAPGDDVLRLRRVRARATSAGCDYLTIENESILEIDYQVLTAHEQVCISIHLFHQGVCAFVGGNQSAPHACGRYQARVVIPPNLLNSGVYSLTVYLITNTTQHRVVVRDVLVFRVEEQQARAEYLGHIIGAVRPRLSWTVEPLSEAEARPQA